MSLGGPTVYDGRDTFDRFILELWKANILVVASAGNSDPIPNTVGSPATDYNSIAVDGRKLLTVICTFKIRGDFPKYI